ncbi:hypothetical protein EMIT0P253_100061 [Pseudomonas sp. IT-P253]
MPPSRAGSQPPGSHQSSGSEPAREGGAAFVDQRQLPPSTYPLNTQLANYYVDISCLSSNISTYILCLGS